MENKRKQEITARIVAILDEYAAGLPEVSREEMPQPEFMAVVEKWQLSTGFLKKFLGKSDATIQTYKYRKNLPISGPVAAKIRQLDAVLSAFPE